jgi:glycine C-acetyltransferase
MAAGKKALDEWGFGMSSVRFICGTQSLHKELENKISEFLGTEDTILYSSAFDANGGIFEPILGEEDAIISDELNHASIIDGVRLCKAQRFRYKNNDMADWNAFYKRLQSAATR